MTEIVTRPPNAAASVRVDPGAVLKALGLNPANPLAQALVLVAQRYDLDPVLKHVGIYDEAVYVHLAGYLHIANRHPTYQGIETIREWDDERYYHAEVRVHRSDRDFAFQRRGKSLKEKPKKNGGTYVDEHADAKAYAQACRRALRMAFNLDLAESDFDPDDPPEAPPPVVEVARRVEQTSEGAAAPATSSASHTRGAPSDPDAAAAGPGDTDVASAGREPPKAAAPTAPPSPPPDDGATPAGRGRKGGRAAPGKVAVPAEAPPAAPTQATLDEPERPVEERSAVVAWCLTNHVPAGQARKYLADEHAEEFGPDGDHPLAIANDLMALGGGWADRAVAYLQAALEANVFEPDGWRD